MLQDILPSRNDLFNRFTYSSHTFFLMANSFKEKLPNFYFISSWPERSLLTLWLWYSLLRVIIKERLLQLVTTLQMLPTVDKRHIERRDNKSFSALAPPLLGLHNHLKFIALSPYYTFDHVMSIIFLNFVNRYFKFIFVVI